jgi:hypothetical protein
MDSDGVDALWVSSGWANDESGTVWSYNIAKGLSSPQSPPTKPHWQLPNQRIFKTPESDSFQTAKIFAQGYEPKVSLKMY